ncbi:hypothetical protein BCR44DRAFT_399787 [Catenaria anguillulae PL171]|uniref:Uncharacterized protein n=1 Tax=Catenaria anguillulae PL171 TaxID=765915 RepID=A0A1Y2I3N3_9FUNG|nr:hypothetical protein BCR44DRAFT_399787 [Catenaria anguillulae PL171]
MWAPAVSTHLPRCSLLCPSIIKTFVPRSGHPLLIYGPRMVRLGGILLASSQSFVIVNRCHVESNHYSTNLIQVDMCLLLHSGFTTGPPFESKTCHLQQCSSSMPHCNSGFGWFFLSCLHISSQSYPVYCILTLCDIQASVAQSKGTSQGTWRSGPPSDMDSRDRYLNLGSFECLNAVGNGYMCERMRDSAGHFSTLILRMRDWHVYCLPY